MMFGKILDLIDKPYVDDTYNYLLKYDKFVKAKEWYGFCFMLLLTMNIMSVVFLVKYWNYEPPVAIQYTQEELKTGKVDKQTLITLSEPRVTKEYLQNWTVHVVNDFHNFNFNDIEEKIKYDKKYFTDKAYDNFLLRLDMNGTMDRVLDNKQLVSMTAVESPRVMGPIEGVVNPIDGYRYWRMEVPVKMAYVAGKTEYVDKNLKLLIVQKLENNKVGFYIAEMDM